VPLVRLKIEHTGGYSVIHSGKFVHQFFDGVIANPKNCLMFYRRKDLTEKFNKKQIDKDLGASTAFA
jgi:hypothetical protein